MMLNMEDRSRDLQSRSGEKVGDLIYLGSWIESTDREIGLESEKPEVPYID